MNRNKIIKECYNRFEEGYFKVKNVPLMSSGNNLEFTGKLLMSLTHAEIKEHKELMLKIANGLDENMAWLIHPNNECFIPRTIYTGLADPNLQERKKNLWEFLDLGNYKFCWIRTDVSYSQFTYLLQGCINNINSITVKMVQYIADNNWIIRRNDGKPSQNGNFNIPCPNIQLRKYFIKELLGEKHNLIEKFYYIFMRYIKPKGSDGLNTVLIYYSIYKPRGFNKRIKNMINNYIEKWMLNYRYEEFQDKITWLLLDKIRNELK